MKVLVVDDDVVSRMVLMHLIDSCGDFEIHEAEDGQAAWEQLEGGLRPAILFCDLRMPRLSGMDLLQRVKADADLRATPFVLVSSATDADTVHQASDCGANGYIVKPFEAEQVRVHLAALSGGAPDAAAEAPLDTVARLGISSEQLLAYLGGFQAQLTAAGGAIDSLLARGERGAAEQQLLRLRDGCRTLGLAGMAARLEALQGAALTTDSLHAALADAIGAVLHQAELTRRLRQAS
ncbi:response regulator [Massilia sp. TS11]|uniref:response regulator n=1 Tax=Massilia sp. TS11 TaxID=2908003 RepID=UPI001ED9C99E|nr:response regulator [Massilia sp. TS11]MCG2585537.1 response regulator [Massilia sp. TS11]